MADSLNSGIQKLGDTLSAKLFGNSKDNPEGSSNFSGIYIGPGGGVTRTDSFTIEGSRYGAAFAPIGYFDKTNSWIDDKLSSIVGPSGLSGITRKDFPMNPNGDIDYKEIYGKLTLSGWTPPGYFNPNTNLWIDGRLSPKVSNSDKDINRSDFIGQPNAAPLNQIPDPDTGLLAEKGFTPVAYTRTGDEIYLRPNSRTLELYGGSSEPYIVSNEEASKYIRQVGENGFFESRKSSDFLFKFGLENPYRGPEVGTPHDNEDPLFLGFEVIIDVPNSPLFNGQAAYFIEKFSGANSEIKSRGQIVNQTIYELSKFFKLNAEPGYIQFSDSAMSEVLLSTPYTQKRHYVKKISGLDKLVESNTPSAQSAFVKYRNDLIKLSFYEDTTLNLGTLASFYKLLYWSRINGKNVIPENLLRFDCTIIASEVRNLTRVVKAANGVDGFGPNALQTLKENVSRYSYQLYECQLFFDKMTHGDTIDIGGSSLATPDPLEVSFSYKFSTMKFERYDFYSDKYKFVDNSQNIPQKVTSKNANKAIITGDEIIPYNEGGFTPLNNGYLGKDLGDVTNGAFSQQLSSIVGDRSSEDDKLRAELTSGDLGLSLNGLKNEQKRTIYSDSFNKPLSEDEMNSAKKSGSLYGGVSDTAQDESEIPLNKDGGILAKAGEKLLQNVKKAALNEAQRQLNNQFRLVNNSLDKIRNSFGIGRMSEPTNVYKNPPGGQFFYDVKNSLRNFGGDVLGGLLGG